MTFSEKEVFRCQDDVIRALSRLPWIKLSPAERMVLGGHLLPEAHDLVVAVARAAADRPDLFSGLEQCTTDLMARQERAVALMTLHQGMILLTERIQDLYLIEQAQTVMDAMEIVRSARTDAGEALLHPREREDALLGPEEVLARRRRPQRPRNPGRRRSPQAQAVRSLRKMLTGEQRADVKPFPS